jgi:uncharacterized protein
MKMQADRHLDQVVVSAHGPGYVVVAGRRYQGSLLLLPDQAERVWDVSGFEQLRAGDFDAVLASGAELLIFGSGQRQRFAHPRLLQALFAARIGVEQMSTAAACRTFNILAGEGRRVAAALIVEAADSAPESGAAAT